MFRRLIRGTAPLLLLFASAASAQSGPPVTGGDLRRHIEVLASDAFEGRAPGTAGENRTTAYIVEQWRARGLEPAGESGSWLQPVGLVERRAGPHQVTWTRGNAALPFNQDDIVLIGRDASQQVADAPVVFVGHGARMPDRGIDQLAGADLRGAVALLLLEGPLVPGFPSLADRVRAVEAAGAAAIVTIVAAEVPWVNVRRLLSAPITRRQAEGHPPILGTMPLAVAEQLVGREQLRQLLDAQPGSSFRAVTLPMRARMEVQTGVNRYTSNNVIGRIRGRERTGENLLFLAHWDHFGFCRAEGEADRICNGAVDNASGIATLIEVAGHLASGRRPARDVLFMATTSEEIGLIGAEEFAARPTVPLTSIVAALNIDTVAIHPAGTPVAVIGRGIAPLDAAIDATVAAMGRELDTDTEANGFLRRQDGWALNRRGVPAVLVSGSFSNMTALNAFLNGAYHGPDDEVGPGLMLDGAAEDANLLVALARRLGEPTLYQRPRTATDPASPPGQAQP